MLRGRVYRDVVLGVYCGLGLECVEGQKEEEEEEEGWWF